MIIKLKDISSNPYRDLKRNPLNPEKVNELVSSIQDTGFWDNVVVRRGKLIGKYELAYGHHRLAAAVKAELTEADFIVKELTDAQMLQILARENKEVYKYTVLALLETVRGTVEALADNKIPAFELDAKVNSGLVRYAPSFVPGASSGNFPEHPYTATVLARFLGYMQADGGKGKADDSVQAALNSLYLIELGQLTEKLIADWTVDKLLTETRARIAAYKDTVVRREQDKEKQRQLREQFEKEKQHNKAEAERLRLENEALLEKERAARKEKAEVDAVKFAEERKENERKREQREAEFKTKRAEFDEKIEEIKLDAQKAKERDRDLPTRHAVKAMLFKLNTITSERFAFREEVKLMAQDKAVTTNERELLRQAMMRAGDWYIEQSNVFLPKPVVNVLAEARQKEEAKRKGRGANEQE